MPPTQSIHPPPHRVLVNMHIYDPRKIMIYINAYNIYPSRRGVRYFGIIGTYHIESLFCQSDASVVVMGCSCGIFVCFWRIVINRSLTHLILQTILYSNASNIISIPHANAYRHDGTTPRIVVYCSFLPDVPINRRYVQQQLQYWKEGRYPSGNQWINHSNNNIVMNTAVITDAPVTDDRADTMDDKGDELYQKKRYPEILQVLSTPLARRLAGIDDWD